MQRFASTSHLLGGSSTYVLKHDLPGHLSPLDPQATADAFRFSLLFKIPLRYHQTLTTIMILMTACGFHFTSLLFGIAGDAIMHPHLFYTLNCAYATGARSHSE